MMNKYSPFSIVDMLRLLEEKYPIEDNVIIEEVFNGNKQFFKVTFDELVELGFIENGTSVYYHWLTEKGRNYLDANE